MQPRVFNRRDFLRMGALATAGVAAVACVPAASPTTQTGGAAEAGSAMAELTFWSRFEFLKPATDLFNEGPGRDAGISVTFSTVPYEQFVEKLTTAVTTSTAPDTCSIDLIQCPFFNSIGAFADLTDSYNALAYKDELSQGMLALGAYEGKQYQLPFSSDNSAFFYNRAIFEEAGLNPEQGPVTWDEYVQAALACTQDDRFGTAYAMDSGGGYMFLFMPWVWGNGGDILTEDGTTAAINSPETLEAVQLWYDMIHTHKAAPEDTWNYSWDDVVDRFKAGKIAMMANGNWGIAQLKTDAPEINFGTTLMPKPADGNHSSFAGGDLMGLLAQTKYVDEGWQLLEYLMSEDVQLEFLAAKGIIPIRTSFYENQYFEEEPRLKVFTQSLDVAVAPWTTKYNRLYDPLQATLQSIFKGDILPEEGLAQLEGDINAILAES
jgi:multiple sugar transport system substrate-binding protein